MYRELPQHVGRNASHLSEVLRFRLGGKELSPIRFIIFGRPRTGSSNLESLLSSQQGLCADGEILRWPLLFPFSHVLARCANSNSPIYCCKLLTYQIKNVQPIVDREGFIRRLHDKGFKIIHLKRENLIHQALSSIRARKFGFQKKVSEELKRDKITVDLGELLRLMQGSEVFDRYETLLLEGVPNLPLVYEEHLLKAEAHQSTVESVCGFLGIECGTAKTIFQKVSPDKVRDSVANYDELVKGLQGTPYAKYLD